MGAIAHHTSAQRLFRLASGVTQKFVDYRMRLAVKSDITAYLGKRAPLRDFVLKENRDAPAMVRPEPHSVRGEIRPG